MSTRIGKGFRQCPDTGKIVARVGGRKLSVSERIKRDKAAKSGKGRVVSRAKARAATKGQRP